MCFGKTVGLRGDSGFSGWIIKKMQKKYQVRRMVAHPLPNFALIIINTL